MEYMKFDELSLHEIVEVIPPMNPLNFKNLVQNIKDNGIKEPLWVMENKIIDGRHRYFAAKEIGLDKLPIRQYSGTEEDLLSFVLSTNVHRRQLSASQRAYAAAKMVNTERGGDRKSKGKITLWSVTTEKASGLFEVSEKYVKMAKKIISSNNQEVIDKLANGLYNIREALGELKKKKLVPAKKIIQSIPEVIKEEETIHKGNLYLELGQLRGNDIDMKKLIHHTGVNNFSIDNLVEMVLTYALVIENGGYSVHSLSTLIKDSF